MDFGDRADDNAIINNEFIMIQFHSTDPQLETGCFRVRRNRRLRDVFRTYAMRMCANPEHLRFYHHHRLINPEETASAAGIPDHGIIDVEELPSLGCADDDEMSFITVNVRVNKSDFVELYRMKETAVFGKLKRVMAGRHHVDVGDIRLLLNNHEIFDGQTPRGINYTERSTFEASTRPSRAW